MRPSEVHIFGSKDWQAEQRHKRLRPSGLVKRRRRYSSKAHDAAMLEQHLADLAAAEQAKHQDAETHLFLWSMDEVALNRPAFDTIRAAYRAAHPRAQVAA